MVAVPIAQIVDFVGGEYHGEADLIIGSVNTLGNATATEISFLSNAKYVPQLKDTRAGAV
jgi:UDP-3-O-[3-hydroxymyristoyl] glucosamine N-acyltransferase